MRLSRIARCAITALFVATLCWIPGVAQDGYRTPPEAITRILDEPAAPAVSVSSDRQWLLITTADVLETTIAELGELGLPLSPNPAAHPLLQTDIVPKSAT
jgi:hypothetical protein